MSSRLDELARRKAALIAQCAQEREELASICRRYRTPLGFGRPLSSIGAMLKAYPFWVAGVSALLVSRRGRGLGRLGLKLLGLWRTIIPLWTLWTKLRARKRAPGSTIPQTTFNHP